VNQAWVQVTSSEFPWEREALDYLKRGLPDHEPYRAWANFEFMLDGVVSEIDALVVVPRGVFLVEIKSWPGRIDGDQGTWRWTRPGATTSSLRDNPYLLTNRKAKRLKSVLARQRAFRSVQPPFVQPLVFLSHADLDCRLAEDARVGVYGLDPLTNGEKPQRGGLPGVVQFLTRLTNEEAAALRGRRIDRPMSRAIAEALEQAGIRPARRHRMVGDLELGEPLDEGPGYQDFAATHPRFPSIRHRVRIYGMSGLAAPEERAQAIRAAQREYELLHSVSHPGIVRAQAFHEHELGPAIVFEREDSEVRLDQFIAQTGASLSLEDRLALVRELVETVAYAHGRRLFHRALSPRSVLVIAPEKAAARRCRISNWQTGERTGAGTSIASVAGTVHVADLIDEASSVYLAPEAITQPGADPELLDVFSLGALAFLIFAGRPPARTLAELVEVLDRNGALEVASVLDGAGAELTALIRDATVADATKRVSRVPELLVYLDTLEEELTAPTREPEREVAPAHAQKGDVLGGWIVERRLGRGSTAIAFLVQGPDGTQRVLKVAADPERNERLRDEGEVLAKLDDQTIIALHGEPIDVFGHTALVLSYASEDTLAKRIREEGRLPLETLHTWGEDLLSAVVYLEREGIPHRDIKPENLGIIERGRSRHRRLVLMDFSLARAPADQIAVGTRPYLDPFLGLGTRTRWDLAADRYAAAVVLHEMATGSVPDWDADPRYVDHEVAIDSDSMPRDLATPLQAFFERALRRDARERFDTAEEMLRSWRRMFERLEDATETETEEAVPGAGALRAAATLRTPVAALGLSARASDALERLGVLSVADLLDTQAFRLNRIRGVGVITRRELIELRRELLAHLAPPESRRRRVPTDTLDIPDVQALDELVTQLVPRRTAQNTGQVAGLRALLGLEPDCGAPGRWPNQTEVAAQLEVTRGRIAQIAGKGRDRWRRLPAVTRLRDELCTVLERLGGIASAAELEREIAAERGADAQDRLPALARAAVRAAVETELHREQPRMRTRRTGDRVLVASAGEDPAELQACLDYALRLGAEADGLAARDTLAGPTEVTATLRRMRAPEALQGLTQERLTTLAAGASSGAAVSARLEFYPRDMAADRALRLARSALQGAERLTISDIRSRVAARFPDAQSLPDRPALDGLLAIAGVELTWDQAAEAYVAPERVVLTDLTSHISSLERLPTDAATSTVTTLPPRGDPSVAEAQDFERRLAAALLGGGLLVLSTAPRTLRLASTALRRFDVTPVDVDELMLRALHAAADELNVRWDLVVRADAAQRTDVDWTRLMALVGRAIPAVDAKLGSVTGVVLLENAGLLARYGQISMLERLRERILAGTGPRGCWVLIPGDHQTERPVLDGVPIPVISTNEAAPIPESWLRNVHRASPGEGRAA
jgi:serine/threonine protein kinase